MEEYVLKWLGDNIASWIIVMLGFIWFIAELCDNGSRIKLFVKNVFSWIVEQIIFRIRLLKRQQFNKELSSKEFLKWQLCVLKKLYFQKNENCGFELTRIKIDKISWEYEAAIWKTDKVIQYPFTGIWDKTDLRYMEKNRFNKVEDYVQTDLTAKQLRMVRQYEKIVGATVHYPKKIGYMMDSIILDGNCLRKVTSKVGNYYQNVLQSHILEYELFLLYKKMVLRDVKKLRRKGNTQRDIRYLDKVNNMSVQQLWDSLPLRKRIHQKCDGRELVWGNGRASLMSVQIMVLIRNCCGKYDCLRIRRSENVAAKAGFLQFIPSGGFEAFNNGDSKDIQWSNYSINKVLFRELGEECFGLPEDNEFCKKSVEIVYENKSIKRIIQLIKEEKAKYQFIGIAESLAGLRPEFCFLLVIDDSEIASDIICNDETDSTISLINIAEMEKSDFWSQGDIEKLNCTSAALWQLARETKLYKECLKKSRG